MRGLSGAAAGFGLLCLLGLVCLLAAPPAAAAPEATAGTLTVIEGGGATVGPTVLAGSDGQATPQQVRFQVMALPSGGRLERLGAVLQAGMTFTQADVDANSIQYLHTGGEGVADVFAVQVTGPSGAGPTVHVQVAVSPVNDLPAVADTLLGVDEDSMASISPVVTDPDGPGASFSIVSQGQHGEATITSTGQLAYWGEHDYYGPDSFDYVVDDGAGGRVRGTVRVDVRPVNDIPFGRADRYEVRPGQALLVERPYGVLANDVDPDHDPMAPMIAYLWATPQHGELVLREDGSFVYTPKPGYLGWDRFTYLARDAGTPPEWTPVMLKVHPNDAPLADFTADAWVVDAGATVSFTSFTTDVDGQVLQQTWDLGDGTLAAGPSVTHTFPVAGLYRIAMSVRDNEGAERVVEHRLEVRRTDGITPPTPTADAGPDQVVEIGAPVALDGRPAHVDQYWIQTAGPAVELQGAETPSLRFAAPAQAAWLSFDLVVFDGWTSSAADRVIVQVLPPESFPRAEAGYDISVQAGQKVRLSGMALNASDEAILTFAWAQTEGDRVDLASDGAALLFTAPLRPQTLAFQLVVSDRGAASDPDDVRITVVSGDPASGFWHGRAAGRELSFTARVDGTSYEWDFGDGHWAEGREVTHEFRSSGRHTVHLTVMQADGSTLEYERTVRAPGERRVMDNLPLPSDVVGPALAAAGAVAVGGVAMIALRRRRMA